jgi:hypothetical protein
MSPILNLQTVASVANTGIFSRPGRLVSGEFSLENAAAEQP